MRISCVAFARLRSPDSRYALLINKRRMERIGHRSLSPIGGGLMVSATGRQYLERLGATDFEGNKNDLRFRVPDHQAEQVAAWFATRRQRETTVLRELTEELVQETGILRPGDVGNISEQFRCSERFSSIAARPDVVERRTTYLIEIFDVWLSKDAMGRLFRASRQPTAGRLLYFVTPREIRARVASDGTNIGQMAPFIL